MPVNALPETGDIRSEDYSSRRQGKFKRHNNLGEIPSQPGKPALQASSHTVSGHFHRSDPSHASPIPSTWRGYDALHPHANIVSASNNKVAHYLPRTAIPR
jgi:hypothetical protein